ncbi:MAG: GAF domain-containing protein, partial [Chloroflexi bacterium]
MNQQLTNLNGPELEKRYRQLLQETRVMSARLAVVNEVSRAVSTALELDAVLEVVVEQTKWVLDYDRCHIALRNQDDETYRQWWLYNPADQADSAPSAQARAQAQNFPLSEGLAGWVIRHSQILRPGERTPARRDAGFAESPLPAEAAGSTLALPLTADGETIGALIFESRQRGAYNDADVRLGTILAAQIAVAIRNAQLLEESRRRTAYIEALNAISRAINASLDIDEVFQTFAIQTRRLIEHDRMSIALLDAGRKTLHVHAVSTDGESALDTGVELPIEGSAVGRVVTRRQPIIQPDTRQGQFQEDKRLHEIGIRSYLDVPLTVKGEVIGTLNVGCRRPNAFSPTDVETLTEIANQVAISIQNQRLHAETQQFA